MNLRSSTPVAGPSGKLLAAGRVPDARWRATYLLLAPHRMGFFLAMVVLICASLWWAAVQFDRMTGALGLTDVLSPSLVHGAVMVFGFIPLFFSGFLFTAGPKWLDVEPLPMGRLLAPMLLQASGWLLWLLAVHVSAVLALVALLFAGAGLIWMTLLFWHLVRQSRAADQFHARAVRAACVVGCLSLAGLAASVALGAPGMALAFVLTGVWGFLLVVYVSVAHRMIPFFTASAVPLMQAWRPFWLLWFMLGVAAFEVLAVWLELTGFGSTTATRLWPLFRSLLELLAGVFLVWLALAWGLVKSLKNRLLAMLHVGFSWLGLALLLGGVAQLQGWMQGAAVLGLGQLHALTMGCLASLMLAMVTRVSCGHSGRSLVANQLVWSLFWLLQVAALLRIAGSAQTAWAGWLLLAAAALWLVVMALWGLRLANWYGRLRADGRAG
jgi:uncharacterized protein involved in response to NO